MPGFILVLFILPGDHIADILLTKSNNISAAQIRDDYDRRMAQAAREGTGESPEVPEGEEENDVEMEEPSAEPTPEAESPEDKAKKRKRQQAIERIKKTKDFARRKARRTGEPDDDDDLLADEMVREKQRPLPGQLENCEICGKRFTVTPYSKTGPAGGLLCADCSKKHAGGEKKAAPKKRSAGIGRRQNQSALLDGLASQGTQSLLETCIKVRPSGAFRRSDYYRFSFLKKLESLVLTSAESGREYRRRGRVWRSSSASDASTQPNSRPQAGDYFHDVGFVHPPTKQRN